jgi:DNA relaxase NicK
MPKTITIPFDVTVNSVKYLAGSTPAVNDTVAAGIVAMVTWTNDSLAFVQKKGRGTFVDATAV